MIETATDFPYLGDRDYIHGTSVLNGFLGALEALAPGRITLKKLKFQRPAKMNGRLVLTPGRFDEAQAAQANCTLAGAVNGIVWRGFFIDEGRPVNERVPVQYPIAALEAHGYGGSCTVSPAGRDELVRVLLEANKRFHEASFPAAGKPAVRFGYVENWSVPAAGIALSSARLEATNLIAKKTDDGVMTINRLTYAQGDAAASLTLCFEAHSRPGT